MYRLTKLDSTKEDDHYGVVLSHGRHTQALRINFEELQQSHKKELFAQQDYYVMLTNMPLMLSNKYLM